MSDESPAPVVAEVRRAPIENVLSSPMAAELLVTLKSECEAQHARAEGLVAEVARLTADLEALRTRLRGLEQQWRERARAQSTESTSPGGWHSGIVFARNESADELARLLTTPEESGT